MEIAIRRHRRHVRERWIVFPSAPMPFTLQLTFAQPSGLSGGQVAAFDAVIAGSTPGGGGPLAVDFDNSWRPFTFGGGSFELALLTDLDVNKNNDATIYGSIRNAPELTVTLVPEPATLLLFGAGALGIASRMRQRRR